MSFTVEQIKDFALSVLAYGGGGATVAYILFRHLGKSWIESKFAQRLEQYKHDQAIEIQRLRVEIDSMLSGALKLQEKEFEILPEAWHKLDEAHGLVSWLASPLQQYPDLDRINSDQLEEFLAKSDFAESEKQELRESRGKVRTYQEISFWYRLHKVNGAISDLQNFVARRGIFLPLELKGKFQKITDLLRSVMISKEVGHQARDWKMENDGWAKIKEEIEPLYKSIESEIHKRLQSHGPRH